MSHTLWRTVVLFTAMVTIGALADAAPAPEIRGYLAVSVTTIFRQGHGPFGDTFGRVHWAPDADAFTYHAHYRDQMGAYGQSMYRICDLSADIDGSLNTIHYGGWMDWGTFQESWSFDGRYILCADGVPTIGVADRAGHKVAQWTDVKLCEMLSDSMDEPASEDPRLGLDVSEWHPFRHLFLFSISDRSRLPSGVWLAGLDDEATGRPPERVDGVGPCLTMRWSPSGDFAALAASDGTSRVSILELETRRAWEIGTGGIVGWLDDYSVLVEDRKTKRRTILDRATGTARTPDYSGELLSFTLHGALVARQTSGPPAETELWWVHHRTRHEALIATVPSPEHRTPSGQARVEAMQTVSSTPDGRYLAYTISAARSPKSATAPAATIPPDVSGPVENTTEVIDTWTGEREQIVFASAKSPSLSWSPRKYRLLYWTEDEGPVYLLQCP